ncbi:MAG TPA: flavodoxin family protein [Dehalococcoidales bacterium]|nr:flavodoxin family protein [Dehalococcoidales bacterium]
MKTLVVYESMYGNTEQIARAIAGGISGEVIIKPTAQVVPTDLVNLDLFIIGSPTQAGRPLKATLAFIEKLGEAEIKGLNTGVFDTRMKGNFAKIFGWAATRMAEVLRKKGAKIRLETEGFFVKGIKGPIVEGEIERAAGWGQKIAGAALQHSD